MKIKILHIIISLFLFGCNNKQFENEKNFYTSIIDNKNIPIVKFSNKNNSIKFIIDTGSELSIIDDDYYCKHLRHFKYITNTECNINTLNSTISSNVIVAETIINDSLCVQFYITNIDNVKKEIFINTGIYIDGIIGCDFLYKNKSVIDFDNKNFIIRACQD